MLVKLYDLPGLEGAIEHASAQGIVIRRALSLEKPRLVEWIQLHFTPWVAEVEAAFCRQPVACFMALRDREILGFACYDATCRNFFGPEGVLPAGACAKSALEPAKQLLLTEQAQEALKKAPQMRDQILDLLAAATPKPRPVEGPIF